MSTFSFLFIRGRKFYACLGGKIRGKIRGGNKGSIPF